MNSPHPDLDRLYRLLPAYHRQRDEEQGGPLRALLQIIAEQVALVEADIDQLYQNWFIETCQDWVVPYLGDLVDYAPIHEAGEPGSAATFEGRKLNKILISRRDVAATIRTRRRKGTVALLEMLALDAAGWPAARVVEFYKLLAVTRRNNQQRLGRSRTVDLRNGDALERLDGPFDEIAHTVDIRRINSHRTVGRFNIPEVGVFVWRIKAFSVTQTPAYCLEEIGANCFSFSVLSNDGPLYNHLRPESNEFHVAGEANLPVPIRRRALDRHTQRYYGDIAAGKSLQIWKGVTRRSKVVRELVSPSQIVVADLTDWQYQPEEQQIAVDPISGRIAFSPDFAPSGVWVSYFYGFSANIGGGEYGRSLSQPDVDAEKLALLKVGENSDFDSIEAAYQHWIEVQENQPHAIIEIQDSGVYTEQLNFVLRHGHSLQLRAAYRTRPVIRLLDRYSNRPDSLTVVGEENENGASGGCLLLNGLLITGRGVHLEGGLSKVAIRHCTLVPGWAIGCDCEPSQPAKPSLEIYKTGVRVEIEHSIIGSIQVNEDEVKTDPIHLCISDSIVDATSSEREAIGAPGRRLAFAQLNIARCTVIGKTMVHAIELAENSLFTGAVSVARRQIGCVRFCYLAPGSRTPRRFECQPDLVESAAANEFKAPERLRVRPHFNSLRYGTPTYCQLALSCADEITRGADDASEMGVFHDLFGPQRAANLRTRLEENIPAGMDAGIIYAI